MTQTECEVQPEAQFAVVRGHGSSFLLPGV